MIHGIIYKYTSPSGKVYIGQTINERKRRNRFLNINDSYSGIKIDRARKKYNPYNFTYEILEQYDIEDEDQIIKILNQREMYYIAKFDSVANGYNCDGGGNSRIGYQITDEAKRNMSIAQTGRKHTEETKLKLSLQRKGKAPIAANKANEKPIDVFTKDNVYVATYDSSTEAAEKLGIKGTANISAVLHGRRKSTGGYIFRFNEK